MTMFVWRSVALQNYARGYIIVEADTPDHARVKAVEEYDRYLSVYYDWVDEGYLNEKRESFRRDLLEEPETLEVLLISGSE